MTHGILPDPRSRRPAQKRIATGSGAPVPTFSLYGEDPALGSDVLHLETIQARSRQYHWEIDVHIHHGLYQIIWLQTGPARIALDTMRLECRAPAVIVIPSGAVHAFSFEPHSEGHVLTLSARAFVRDDLPAIGDALHDLFSMPRALTLDREALEIQRLDSLFNELAAEFRAPDMPGSPITQWLARAVVWRLAQVCLSEGTAGSPNARKHHALFTRFVLTMERHYLEHWPISRYAAQLGLTPERLNRLTRAETGHNALELVHERLLREASRRLIYVAAPISSLAFELGFKDPAYFCRFFKRHTGLTPKEFRVQQHAAAD
jgi:AraC family transcriptional regulator, transcriptional activator of pobA